MAAEKDFADVDGEECDYDSPAPEDQEAEAKYLVANYKNFNEISKDSEVHSIHDTRASVFSGSGRPGPPTEVSTNVPQNMSSHRDTFVNSINVLMGLGVLGLPYAFAHGGWVTLPLAALMAALSCYTAHLLGVIQREVMQVTPPPHIPAEAAGMYVRKRDASGKLMGGRAFVKKQGAGHWEVAWEKGKGWDMFLVGDDLNDVHVDANSEDKTVSPTSSPSPSPTSESRKTLLTEKTGLLKKNAEMAPQNALVQRLENYPDVARGAFGAVGYAGIQLLFCCELYLYVVSLVIVAVENIMVFTDSFSRTELALIYGLCILPQSFVRDFSKLSFLSWIGAIAGFMVLFSLMYFGFTQDTYQPHVNGTGSITDPAETATFEGCTIPMSFALIMGALSGHSLFPSLRADMYKPMKYSNIVMYAFAVISVFYATTGSLGYLMYGKDVKDMVTQNFDPAHPLTKAVAVCLIMVAYCKHGLNMNALSKSLESVLTRAGAPDNWATYMPVRLFATAACVAGSLLIPNFHAVMGIVGAGFSAVISLGFPLAAHVTLFRQQTTYPILAFHSLLLLGSLFFAITGTMLSVGVPLCASDLAP